MNWYLSYVAACIECSMQRGAVRGVEQWGCDEGDSTRLSQRQERSIKISKGFAVVGLDVLGVFVKLDKLILKYILRRTELEELR